MIAKRQKYDDYDDHAEAEHTKKRVRLTFDVAPDLRRRIKMAAVKNNLTLNEYLGQVLDEVVPVEEEITQTKYRPVTQKTLEAVDRIREGLMQGREENFFGDSVESIRQMREERTKYLMGEE
ncbi:MAG TPA: hypothetical protein VNG51_25380 [Ktedonobacteraceae bacterium]|nr:hypothetical protein [Ktedonobacteraceae bacterium]